MQQFFYDAQIRRFLLQFTRIVSNFQVEYGRDGEQAALLRVPVRYGDATRNAQTILQENSAASMNSTPLMTFYVSALTYDRPRMQEPYHVNTVSVRQRTYDTDTETYETTQGNAFTIERLMPVPYRLGITLDIWTSNTNQKFQLLEQILTLFNPSLEIQSTDNYLDWTSLSVVELDDCVWTSRTIPQGAENPIDIATLKFGLPIWISSPAKVKKLGVVERVIANMYDAQGDLNNAINQSDLLLGTRMAFTPYTWAVVLINNKLQCLQQQQLAEEPSNDSITPTEIVADSNLLWPAVIGVYGVLRPGISQIRLTQPDETEVIGTVVLDPNDDRFLLFDVDQDTAPQNTLSPVDAIVNPLTWAPAPEDSNLEGVRYLLTEATGATGNMFPAEAWLGANNRALIAKANDIIEYSNNYWHVVFNAEGDTDIQYVTNITTGIQYKWDGHQWIKSYQGIYPGGTWSLVL
jgi:hypothetical protein